MTPGPLTSVPPEPPPQSPSYARFPPLCVCTLPVSFPREVPLSGRRLFSGLLWVHRPTSLHGGDSQNYSALHRFIPRNSNGCHQLDQNKDAWEGAGPERSTGRVPSGPPSAVQFPPCLKTSTPWLRHRRTGSNQVCGVYWLPAVTGGGAKHRRDVKTPRSGRRNLKTGASRVKSTRGALLPSLGAAADESRGRTAEVGVASGGGRAGGRRRRFLLAFRPRPPRPWRPSHQRTPRASDDRVWRGRGPVRLRAGSGTGGRAPSRLRCRAPLPAPALGIPGPRAPLSSAPIDPAVPPEDRVAPGDGPPCSFFAASPGSPGRGVQAWRAAAGAVAPGPMARIGIRAGCSSPRRPCLLSLGSRDGQVLRSHPRLLPPPQTCPETSLPSCARPYPKSSCPGLPLNAPNLSGPQTSAPLLFRSPPFRLFPEALSSFRLLFLSPHL